MTDLSLPYGRQQIDDADIAAVVDVLRSDWLTTGPMVDAFESALSEVVGGHPVVTVNSGTAALHAAYAAAGVGPHTNVVTSPLTFAATATTALHLGAEVRFADIDEDTLLIDPHEVASQVDDATRVIAPVDFAGQAAAVEALRPLADSVGAVLVADAAHSLGGSRHGRPVGDLADMTTFSFHPVKTITSGEGGAVVVRDPAYLDAVRSFRNHGLTRDPAKMRWPDEGAWHQEVQTLGLNYRMPDILAALGRSQLRKLPRFVERRSELVDRYRSQLSDVPSLRLVEAATGNFPAWHLFPVRVTNGRRREVFESLRTRGILVQVHYLPVHMQPLFQTLGFRPEDLPRAKTAYEQLISLPLYPGMTDQDQERVVTALRETCRP